MEPETSEEGTPISCTNQRERSSVWHVILLCLTPLALLAVIGVIVLTLVMLIRFLIDPARFVVQQLSFTIVMFGGLALAIIIYTMTIKRALRQIETWRQSGHTTEANAGLVALTIVAIIIVLPLILALFFH